MIRQSGSPLFAKHIYQLAAIIVAISGIISGLAVYEKMRDIELQELAYRADQKIDIVASTLRNEASKYYLTLHGLAKLLVHPNLSSEDRQSLWQRFTNDPDSIRRHNEIALRDFYYIDYKPASESGPIKCILRDAYLRSQKPEEVENPYRTGLYAEPDLCEIPSAREIFNYVKTTKTPSLIALEDLDYTPILARLDDLDQPREPALIYPFYNNEAELKGWIIGAIDFSAIQNLLRNNHILGDHVDVFDISRLGIRPIMSNTPLPHREKPLTQSQVTLPTETVNLSTYHQVPSNVAVIHQFPSEIRYFKEDKYFVETQLFIAGRRFLVMLSHPYEHALYAVFAGAGVCVLFFIISLIILVQSRVRKQADILAIKMTERLQASEDRLKAAAEGSNDGIWDWDILTGKVWFSKRYYEILGYKDQGFPASYDAFRERVHPDDIEAVEHALKEHLEDHKLYDFAFRMKHKKGHYIWIRTRGQARFEGEKAVRFAGVHTDITREKDREEELAEAHKKAKSAAEVKAQFLANMSHEIRTPLNGIVGISELLSQTQLTSKQAQYVETLSDSSDTLLQIVNDILDYSKLDASKMSLETIPFLLSSAAESCMAISMPEIDKKQSVELIYRYAPNLPRHFMGDPTRIRQIISNLLSNAIKFTDSGYVMVDIDGAKTSTPNEYMVRIQVQDTGIGMSKEQCAHAFEKFSQADDSTTRKYGGTGLGLSIIHELAKLHGGTITVQSEPEKGTNFTVELPLKAQKTKDVPLLNYAPLNAARILVVDPLQPNIHVLSEMLGTHGAQVVGCNTPQTALELLLSAHRDGNPFQAAILDHGMRPLTGPELARQIKQSAELAKLHLLLVTSQSRKGDGAHMRALGFEAYLQKPLLAEHLCFALSVILDAQHETSPKPFITRHSYHESLSSDVAPHEAPIPESSKHESLVMVVEDNPTNQQVIAWILEDLGVQHLMVANGKIALSMLDKHPDIRMIIMDCHMPVMDGITATRLIRQRTDNYRDIPIIALSANNQAEDKTNCLETGMNAYLSKPIERQQLMHVLAEFLPNYTAASPKTTVPSAPKISGSSALNTNRFSSLTSGNPELAEKFFRMFGETVEEAFRGIEQSIKEKDTASLRHHAHTLKGAAANLSAEEMATISSKLEALHDKPKGLREAPAMLTTLKQAHERFMQASSAYLVSLDLD